MNSIATSEGYLNNPSLIREVVDFCNDVADKMIAALGKEFGYANPKVKRRYLTNLRYNHSHGGSYRGKMGISIVLITPILAAGRQTYVNFPEYDHIKNDPEIGMMNGITWKQYCAALIAHELAHAFQYSNKDTAVKFSAKYSTATSYKSKDGFCHGEVWQSIYRFLRVNYVNNVDFDAAFQPKVYKKSKTYKVIGSVTVKANYLQIRVGAGKYKSTVAGNTFKLVKGFKMLSRYFNREFGYVSILVGDKLCRIKGSNDYFEIHMDKE